MRSVSQAFVDASRSSHAIVAEVDLHFPGEPTPVPVDVEGGSLTIDRTAQNRRSGSIVIPWSLEAAEALGGIDIRTLPYGGHAVLRAGIRYANGTSELVTLSAWMRVESVTWDTLAQSATLELADRMAQVNDEPFHLPFDTLGLRPAQAAEQIVFDVFGATIDYRIEFDPATPLIGVIFSGSRAQALVDLARAVGGEAYFDADGAFVFDVASGGGQVSTTGDLVDESTVITGIPDTSGIVVGMTVTGVGIPSGRRVVSVDSPTQVTLNARANTIGAKNSRTTPGSNVLTDVTDTDDLMPGMAVSAPGFIPPGAVVVMVTAISTVTISHAATAEGNPLVGFNAPEDDVPLLFAGGMAQYPSYAIVAGEAGTFIGANESLDRSGIYNGVLIIGQETPVTPAFQVLVVDDVPGSPTEWAGPFGKVARVERSNSIQSTEQAGYVGETMLNDALGLTRSLAIQAAPFPALEAGDTIRVVFEDGRDEKHVVDVAQIDLGPTGPLALTTRSVFRPDALELLIPTPARTHFVGAAAWRELRHDVRLVA
jgi:hypothetical protein